MPEFAFEDPLIGAAIGENGRFVIETKLAKGGMGSVYRALDTEKTRYCAVKVLHRNQAQDQEWVTRFKREGQRFATIKHKNVVRVKQLGRIEDSWYVIFEYIEGQNLYEYERMLGAVPLDDCLRICSEVARGIQATHDMRFVHRDLKPENIMIRKSDKHVTVVDFGIAKSLDTDTVQTAANVFIGTAGYASPEQVLGKKIGPKSDIFSLGVVLYELVTGQTAFEGEKTTEILVATNRANPIDAKSNLERLAKPIRVLIMEMLQRSPRRRPESMTEIADRLDAIRESDALEAMERDRVGFVAFIKSFFETKK